MKDVGLGVAEGGCGTTAAMAEGSRVTSILSPYFAGFKRASTSLQLDCICNFYPFTST